MNYTIQGWQDKINYSIRADPVKHERDERESMAIMQTYCGKQEQGGRAHVRDKELSLRFYKTKNNTVR